MPTSTLQGIHGNEPIENEHISLGNLERSRLHTQIFKYSV